MIGGQYAGGSQGSCVVSFPALYTTKPGTAAVGASHMAQNTHGKELILMFEEIVFWCFLLV